MSDSISKAQLISVNVSSLDRKLNNPLPKTYNTYRTIRKDPTIALARALSVAPVVAASWGVEADEEVDEERQQFIADTMLPLRDMIIETAMFGGVDFGWQAFEKIFHVNSEGRIALDRVKSLLHDINCILIDTATGEFAGIRQSDGPDIPLENVLLFSFRVEGTQWYGESLLENIRETYNEWKEADSGAAVYDKKIAGSRIIVKYPPGQSEVNGALVDNGIIARDFVRALEGAGSVTMPTVVASYLDELNKDTAELLQWNIEILTDGGKQATFTPRLEYLDTQKVRGLLIPERAILEGKFGTKAEAGQHADLALTAMMLTHEKLTRKVNRDVVDQLLVLNWGEEARGSVRLIAAPLADEKLGFLRTVYEKILSDPGSTEIETVDRDTLKQMLGVPITEFDPEEGNDDKPLPFRPQPGLEDDELETVRSIGG